MNGQESLKTLLDELKHLKQRQVNYQQNLRRLELIKSKYIDPPIQLQSDIIECEETLRELDERIPELEKKIREIQPDTDFKTLEPITEELMISGKRYAVVAGPRYVPEEQELDALKYTGADVDTVGRLLRNDNIGGFHEVIPLKDTLRERDIFRAIKNVFKQTEQNDLVLLYLSGHVMIDSEAGWYFLDSETPLEDYAESRVSLGDIKKYCIIPNKARHVIMILDCLYHTKDDIPFSKEILKNAFETLADVAEEKQIVIISSLAKTLEEKEGATHGLLTHYLAEGMQTGQADFSKDGRTTLEELHKYACYAPHFKEQDETYPEPLKWELHSKGDIVIASTSDKPLTKGKHKYIADLLKKGEVIPFLGVCAMLPILQKALSGKMSELTGLDPTSSPLTLLSQYYELTTSRRDLYDKIKETLLQELELKPTEVHRLLAKVDAPLIVITTMYDPLLEEVFQAQDKKYVLIAHLANPRNEGDRGKVVVKYFHGKDKGETQGELLSPERLLIEGIEEKMQTYSVIYKIQGSLNLRNQDVEEEGDSLVISEKDYLSFLEWFTIPEPLNRPLKTKMLLFLGCPMKDWNSRLLLHTIFRDRQHMQRQPYAVRKPDDPIEEIYLRKDKGIELIEEDLSDFITELAEDMEINLNV